MRATDFVLPEPIPEGSQAEGWLLEADGDAAIASSEERFDAVGAGGLGGLQVVPEQHRAAVDALAGVLRDLALAESRWRSVGVSGDVGMDPVSEQLTRNMDEMLRRAREYTRTWAEQVRAAHDVLRAQLTAYEAAEQAAADSFAAS